MPETTDLKALAERYLDLWEEQFASAAADPALAAAMAAWLGPWRALAAGNMAAPPGKAGRKSDDRTAGNSETSREPPAPSGPASTAAAPRDGGSSLDRILEQLERIERRLDALERKRAGKGGVAGAGAGRGRSRGPR